ncbi:DUF427 domain-containing protein [Kushneria phosphatilytica]|uniref:DUF427 domain-containing protein n=1 Tax=Kushneria phosphatilytica TaxID=657387 RepID=A0A1S1NT50_9GAMM|nr:DUF427 domain-containing protein [Kushneria phosphatilytica]OHV08783.1 hypothetical protein BH688_12255 [Kushneria phosphatilytica]QEL12503.1 DUF427 domain-containing protein [Kushneria phosphatilytica]
MIHNPEGRITLHPHTRRVRVWLDDVLLADSRRAIELRETNYPPRQYLPQEDVELSRLSNSATVTYCPFKGHARYFADHDGTDIAWSYETPLEFVADIRERLAFDGERITETIDD